ncbi:Zinc finger, RING-CH-type [Dillenia turbinata]|uniref:Zinc finger, RING-CH-type n=1 Tax=Dillenia turbinata TaxID=194707 RepID=A0AAN8ULI6_9MAGN
MDLDTDGQIVGEKPTVTSNSNSNSNHQIDHGPTETVIVIGSTEMGSGNHENVSNVSTEEREENVVNHKSGERCVIDMKCVTEKEDSSVVDEMMMCRICHLTSDSESVLIQLGCKCKSELGVAHTYCAETWFRLKGNRFCEICGETAKNIKGVADNRFMEEWNDSRLTGGSNSTSNRARGCLSGQPFCNFLMACLVMAFFLPWFSRLSLF